MIYTINLILGGGTEVRRCDAENQINFNKDREKKKQKKCIGSGHRAVKWHCLLKSLHRGKQNHGCRSWELFSERTSTIADY